MANLLSTTVNGQLNTGNVIDLGYTVSGSISTTAFRGINFHAASDLNYYIGKPAGAWTQPLHIHFYTGIWIRSHHSYGGTRFYNIATGSNLMSIGDGSDAINVYTKITSSVSSGTVLSHASMDDALGWNASYGTYIGSTVGGTSYLYANGTLYTGGVFRTLIHSGNIGSQSVASAGSATNSSQLQGYSAYSIVEESRGVHSGSDFPNGTLVRTDINADGWAGNSFVMEVSGKSYGSGTPFKLAMEGYLYADTVINVSAMSYGSYFPGPVKVMRLDGTLAFWWPRGSYWNSFQVHVRNADGESWNRVTGISDSVDPPSADKKVSVTPVQVIHTNNIASQSVSYATTAGALTSMNISQFTNNSGYITSVGNITRLWAESHPTDYYVRANWTGTYWQLTSNHPSPVQVGYADSAGSAGSLTSMNISQFTNNSGYITGYTETDTLASVTGRGATTASQVSFTKTDDHAISVGTIRGRVVNSQGGEFIQLYERVNIGGPNGWGAANTAAPSYGLSVYGGATIGYGNSGGLAVTGTLSATNFSGSSSGTNTGDQTNISGNAATATYATSAGNADTVDSLHASSFVRNDTTRQYLKPYFEYSEYLTTQSPLDLVNQMGGGGLRVDFLHPSYTANGNWGHVITWSGYNGYTMYQMSGSYGSGADVELYVRNEANHERNAWSSWRRLLHDNNYNSYAPTLTGTGASGTWGISITGNANTATTAGSLTSMNISQFTNNSGYLTSGLSTSGDSEQEVGLRYASWNDGVRRMNTDPRWNESGYDDDLGCLHIWSWTAAGVAYGRAGIALFNGSAYQYLTTKSGETGMFVNNKEIIHSGNIASQSVSYATTAGSAPNAGNVNPFYNVTAGVGNGLRFWGADDYYKISMGVGGLYQYGPVIDYSIKTQMDAGSTGRGFTWGNNGVTPVAALNATSGNMQIAGTFTASNFSGSSSGTNTGDQTNISGNAATATSAVNLSGLGSIQSTSTGTSYINNYQVRENSGGGSNTNEIYAPQLAFHWSGVVASSIMMEASGRIAIRNNPGGSYENFIANIVYASSDMRAPIFYDSADTGYYGDFASTSRLNTSITNVTYFGADTNKGYAQGWNTYSSTLHKIAYVSFDWNGNYDTYSNHGIASTDSAGNFADSISINSFNDITFRLDSNANNGDSYVRFMNDTTGSNAFSSIGYNGSTYYASFSRDLYIDGNRGGNFGNRLVIGGTTTPYTMQDGNIRPTAYLRGAYPVLTLDHTETSNTEHGPTIQFAFNGSDARQWLIGCGGSGNFMDFGFSNSGYGNTNYNPHNGISGYQGNTIMRIIDSRVGIGGDWGVYGSVANPEHTLDVRGTIFSNTDMRAPIFYDSADTGYSWNPNTTSAHRFSTPNGYVDIGPMNGGWCHFQTDRPRFYFGNSVTVDGDLKRYSDGALYIHSSNYNSYAPTLTGEGASGSWGISITGSAGGVSWANVSSKPSRWLNTTNLIDDNAPDTLTESGFWQSYLGSGNPTGTWFNYVNVRHSNPGNGHGFQLGMSYYDNNLWFRSYQGNGTYQTWSRALGTSTDPYPSNMNQYVRTTDDVTHNSTTSPLFLVNGHSDNTKGYRIHNTSGSSVSAMFTNSSNQLVIAAGAVDQINLNKKVYVNGVALGVNFAPSATAGRIDASNDIVAFNSSDERLKENITPIANALDKVKSLTGVEFDWKPEHKEAHGHEGRDTGIIAQQVLAVMPTAVRTNDTGYLAVRYEKLISLLIEGMKEQQTQIDELKTKLDGLTK
jgi:hypothetical protein